MFKRVESESKYPDDRFKSGVDNRGRYWVSDLGMLPQYVFRDLRAGSLDSLGRYITESNGVLDIDVAKQLVCMLLGSKEECEYRLVLRRHPDLETASHDKGKREGLEDMRMSMAEYVNSAPPRRQKSYLNDLMNEHGLSEGQINNLVREGRRLLADPDARQRRRVMKGQMALEKSLDENLVAEIERLKNAAEPTGFDAPAE